ncbi:MAG: hypothetical protein WA631_03200 [Nitrososphaeraceae archaeon]
MIEFNEVNEDVYHDDMPVMFGFADAVNAIDIIQQIGRVDVPKVKCFLGRCVQLIKDKEGHSDESSPNYVWRKLCSEI